MNTPQLNPTNLSIRGFGYSSRIFRIFSEKYEEIGQLNSSSPEQAVRDWNRMILDRSEPRASYARITLR